MIALLAIAWVLGALTVWAVVLVGARSERMDVLEDRIHPTSGRLIRATPIHRKAP